MIPVRISAPNHDKTRRLATSLLPILAALGSQAQSYTAVDLTPSTPYNQASVISDGVAGGFSAPLVSGALTRAMIWDGNGATDLHPSFLSDPFGIQPGRSLISGVAGNLQVGSGAGPGTGGRLLPLAWHGTAGSAVPLPIPFPSNGGQATATDGSQIVGHASSLSRDGTTQGPQRGLVWDASTGAVTDLGDGGKGATLLGVGGGQQVGFVQQGASAAALWRGTSRSLVVLHPKGALSSAAAATDGTRQVGHATYSVRVRREAANGNHDANFSYATAWTGSATSAVSIHPSPVHATSPFSNSYAVATAGGSIVGHATDASKFGTPAYHHAIVWAPDFQSVDLNAFLPAGFVGAQALAIDAHGNIAGAMTSVDGRRHAVVWIPSPSPAP